MNDVKEIIKKYGDGVVLSGDMVLESKQQVISWSPALDIILGGSVPEGSWVTLTGEPKCGKTTSALHLIAKAQQDTSKDRPVYYLNIEGRLKPRDLKGIPNLNLEHFQTVGSYFDEKTGKGRILSAEEYLAIAENVIKEQPGSIVVIDSVAQLVTEKELTSEIHEQHRAPGAKLVSNFCKRISNVLPVNKNIVIAITHQIANVSGYGKSKVESGGRKIAYAVDVKLEAKRVTPWKVGSEDDAPIGQIVTWETHSTAIIAPGQKIDSYIRYGSGIDEMTEIIRLGVDTGFITKAGAWLTCSFMEDHLKELGVKEWGDDAQKMCRVQGQEKMRALLTENPSWFKILDSEIKQMFVG